MCNSVLSLQKKLKGYKQIPTTLISSSLVSSSNKNSLTGLLSTSTTTMHKTPFTMSVARKVSLEGMAMRSKAFEALPQHDEATSRMTSHGSLADQSTSGKVTPSGSLGSSPSPIYDMMSSSSPSCRRNYRSSNRSATNLKKRDQQKNESGLTFKGHPRQFAKHNYHDHANDDPGYSTVEQVSDIINVRGGVKTPFPLRLHTMLDAAEKEGLTDIVSWQPHGRAFLVHDPKRFVDEIMPRFFQQHKYSSFQRQLNLYGFMRLTRKGPDHGGYYHELFLRQKVFLCTSIQRIRVKGTLIRTTSSPETEPNFYQMPEVAVVTPTPLVAMITPIVTPSATVQTPHPSVNNLATDELDLLSETRRRLDQALANVTFPQQQLPPTMNADLNLFLEATASRWEASSSDESDLACFLDDVDFYDSDVELLAEV